MHKRKQIIDWSPCGFNIQLTKPRIHERLKGPIPHLVLAKFKKHSEMDQAPKEAWSNPEGIQHTSNLKTKEKLTHKTKQKFFIQLIKKLFLPMKGWTTSTSLS